ncbi:hypothetical protein NKH77_55050 [Streptomyces sp. M19]
MTCSAAGRRGTASCPGCATPLPATPIRAAWTRTTPMPTRSIPRHRRALSRGHLETTMPTPTSSPRTPPP